MPRKRTMIPQTCEYCGEPFARGRRQTFCSYSCSVKARHEPFPQRFWAKVDKRSLDECWEWQANANPLGYGKFRLGQQMAAAHRVSYELTYGAIPDGLYVLHKCDNPPCCNPTHLFLGDAKDNARDRGEKGRSATGERNAAFLYPERTPRGEAVWQAKLTEQQVREIRAATGIRNRELAERYGVQQPVISKIRNRRLWKHVT